MVHHHTVDTISFIARDTLDPRAFSYIHTSGDNVYHLFAIKTEAAVRKTRTCGMFYSKTQPKLYI